MKALVVEDDFISRKILQQILVRYGECNVAVDGEEALSAIEIAEQEKEPYDLVCLDLNMPKKDGLTTLKEIRGREEKLQIEPIDGIKVIITTGRDDKESVLAAFRDGCEAYITKPLSPENIAKQLQNLGLIEEKSDID